MFRSGLSFLGYSESVSSCFLDGLFPDEADPWICADNLFLGLELGEECCAYPR